MQSLGGVLALARHQVGEEGVEVKIKERSIGRERQHHVRRASVDKEGGASALPVLEQVVQLELYALQARWAEIDRVHRLGKIECNDERRLVFGKGRLLALPRWPGDRDGTKDDKERKQMNRTEAPAATARYDEMIEQFRFDIAPPAHARVVADD